MYYGPGTVTDTESQWRETCSVG